MNKKYHCKICDIRINRSYIKKHEISQKHQNNIKNTLGYALEHLFMECKKCKERLTINELLEILYDDYEDIRDIAEENKYSAWEVSAPTANMHSGKGGDTINYSINCECSTKHNLDIYVEFTFHVDDIFSVSQPYYIDTVDRIIPLKSNSLRLLSSNYLLEGRVILNLLHWLFVRWAAMDYAIEIVSPFVDNQACWDKLFDIAVTFSNRVHSRYPITVFSRYSQRKGVKYTNMKVLLKEWLKEKENEADCYVDSYDEGPCFEDLNYPCIHNLGSSIIDNVSITRRRFHAKYYKGTSIDGHNEIVFSSFNLIRSELNQLETFCMLNDISSSIKNRLTWERLNYRALYKELRQKT